MERHADHTKPRTPYYLRRTKDGTRIFTDQHDAVWHADHSVEERDRQAAAGNLAALVCSPEYRQAHDRSRNTR